jgi:ATP adenylyltransferase
MPGPEAWRAVSMDYLWSPWRLAYVTGSKENTACVFCRPGSLVAPSSVPPGGRPPDADALTVFEGQTCYIVLNLYPYNNGHLLVVPYRHTATLSSLSLDELEELARLTQLSEAALTEAYRPQGINVGINLGRTAGAGVVEHLHVHLVPRWHGDTNFMTVVGDTRVLPEALAATAARLRPVFERLAG